MRRLIIHTGWPRTGTTFLQRMLFHNRDALLERGVLYPEAGLQRPAHHPWTTGLVNREHEQDWVTAEPWEGIAGALDTELAKASCNTVVVSSEVFTLADRIATLKERLERWSFTVTILSVVREHLETINSVFNRQLSTRATRFDPAAFVASCIDDGFCSYGTTLDAWSRHFGKDAIRVIPFQTVKDGDFRFLNDVLGTRVDDLANNGEAHEIHKNASLSPTALFVLQNWPEEGRLIGPKYWSLRKMMSEYSQGTGGFTFFDISLQRAILEAFEEDRRTVKSRYGIDLRPGQIRESVPFEPDADELIHLVYRMWEELRKR